MTEENDKEVKNEGKPKRYDPSVVVLGFIFLNSTIWFLNITEGFSALAVIQAVFYGTMQTLFLFLCYALPGQDPLILLLRRDSGSARRLTDDQSFFG